WQNVFPKRLFSPLLRLSLSLALTLSLIHILSLSHTPTQKKEYEAHPLSLSTDCGLFEGQIIQEDRTVLWTGDMAVCVNEGWEDTVSSGCSVLSFNASHFLICQLGGQQSAELGPCFIN